MNEKAQGRPMLVAVYRAKPNAFQSKGGYWFLRIENPVTGRVSETALIESKAKELEALGVPRLEDGGGL